MQYIEEFKKKLEAASGSNVPMYMKKSSYRANIQMKRRRDDIKIIGIAIDKYVTEVYAHEGGYRKPITKLE